MLRYDFEQSIGYWLIMAAREYERAVNDELAPQGITYRQAQVLGWLALEGELCQADLAERLRIEPPTLVPLLDRMEQDGWIRRVACDSDRRKKLIQPTADARPAWSKIVSCARRIRRRALRDFTDREAATIKRLLGKLRQNLEAAKPSLDKTA